MLPHPKYAGLHSGILFIFLVLLTGCISTGSSGSSGTGSMNQVKTNYIYHALEKEDYNSALVQCDQILSSRPDHVDALLLKGFSLYRTDRPEEAVNYLSRAIVQAPRGEAIYYRGRSFLSLWKSDLALSDANEVLNSSDKIQDVARFYGRLGNTDDMKVAKSAVHQLRSAAYDQSGETAPALKEINRAIALNPVQPAYYSKKGQILLKKKEFHGSSRSFKEAVRRYPDSDSRWREFNSLGVIELFLGNYPEAVAYFNRSNSANQNPGALSNSGVAHGCMGNYSLAVTLLNQAAAEGNSANTWFHLGYFHHLMNRNARARQSFLTAKELDPKILEARVGILNKPPASSPTRKFYQSQIRVARTYLEGGKKQGASTGIFSSARVPEKKKAALIIEKLVIDPDPVPVNTRFDIKFLYKPVLANLADPPTTATFYLTISQNGKLLYRSKPKPIEMDNHRENEWTEHMNPVPRPGRYTVDVFLESDGLKARKQTRLTLVP